MELSPTSRTYQDVLSVVNSWQLVTDGSLPVEALFTATKDERVLSCLREAVEELIDAGFLRRAEHIDGQYLVVTWEGLQRLLAMREEYPLRTS